MNQKYLNIVFNFFSTTFLASLTGFLAINLHLRIIQQDNIFLDVLSSSVVFIYFSGALFLISILLPLFFATPSWLILLVATNKTGYLFTEKQYLNITALCIISSIIFFLTIMLSASGSAFFGIEIGNALIVTISLAAFTIIFICFSPKDIKKINAGNKEKPIGISRILLLSSYILIFWLSSITSSFIISMALKLNNYPENLAGYIKIFALPIIAIISTYIPVIFYLLGAKKLFSKLSLLTLGSFIYILLFFWINENGYKTVTILMSEKFNIMEKSTREYVIDKKTAPLISDSWSDEFKSEESNSIKIDAKSLFDIGRLIVLCPPTTSFEISDIIEKKSKLESCIPFYEGDYSKGRKIIDS